MAEGINYTGDLPRYVLGRLFDHLTDKCDWTVDDRNNVDLLRIITRGTKSKFQLTIRVFLIAFAMLVIEKVAEFLNTLTMQYELWCKWWINAIVTILYWYGQLVGQPAVVLYLCVCVCACACACVCVCPGTCRHIARRMMNGWLWNFACMSGTILPTMCQIFVVTQWPN